MKMLELALDYAFNFPTPWEVRVESRVFHGMPLARILKFGLAALSVSKLLEAAFGSESARAGGPIHRHSVQ